MVLPERYSKGLGYSLTIVENSMNDLTAAYREAPYGMERFAEDILGLQPHPYQRRILRALMTHKRVAVRGLHGIGKTLIAAVVNCWAMGVFPSDVKVINTASVWRQLTRYLLPEVQKWAIRANWQRIGITMRPGREIQKQGLTLPGKEAFAVSCTDPTAIEGAHAKRLVYVFDEGKAIPEPTWDAAEGAFSNAGVNGYEAYALAISTPGPPAGRFYQIHQRKAGLEEWYPIHVTLQDAIEAGIVSEQWAENRRLQWGETDPRYLTRVLAEFADSADEALIKLSMVALAQERYLTRLDEGLIAGDLYYGADIARKGEDRNAIAEGLGNTITRLEYNDFPDTMRMTGRIINSLLEGEIVRDVLECDKINPKDIPIGIDDVGVGGGVTDRIKELGYAAVPLNVGLASRHMSTHDKRLFDNLRSELWWTLYEGLDPKFYTQTDGTLDDSEMLALPPDDDALVSDLTTPHWAETSDGRVHVESKKKIQARMKREGRPYRSSDGADSILAALYARRMGRFEVRAAW